MCVCEKYKECRLKLLKNTVPVSSCHVNGDYQIKCDIKQDQWAATCEYI